MEQKTNVGTMLRLGAIGATLAMLPLLIIIFLAALKVFKNAEMMIGANLGRPLMGIQVFGCIIWSICMLMASGKVKRHGYNGGGFTMLGVMVLIIGVIQFVMLVAPDLMGEIIYKVVYRGVTGFIIGLGCTIAVFHALLWGGAAAASRSVNYMGKISTGFAIITFWPLITWLVIEMMKKNASAKTAETVVILLFALLLLAAILVVIGMWSSVKGGNELDEEPLEDDGSNISVQYTAAPDGYAPQPASSLPPHLANQMQSQTPQPASSLPPHLANQMQNQAPQPASSLPPHLANRMQSQAPQPASSLPPHLANQMQNQAAAQPQPQLSHLASLTQNQTSAAQHTAPVNQPQSGPISEQQKFILMSYSDAQLQGIIDNPTLYANPAYVKEASAILAKRRAWEAIKDKADDELIDILHSPDGTYTYDVLDAASMELFSRQSPLLFQELSSCDAATLQDIAAGNGYYDGYIQAARQILGA